jgi:hypothetical protein
MEEMGEEGRLGRRKDGRAFAYLDSFLRLSSSWQLGQLSYDLFIENKEERK